jgi:hypothetical protein
MTTKLETNITRWTGVSSDIKPSSGVPEGSTYHYIDTGEKYIYHNGMWEEDLSLRNALKEV